MPHSRAHHSPRRPVAPAAAPTPQVPAARNAATLGEREFNEFRRLIHDVAGIALTPAKRDLVISRLTRRMRAVGSATFADYLALLEKTPRGTGEWTGFTNALTTNLTSFFRESHHFTVLTKLLREQTGPIRIWSAGCSTGEEPWSIAMTAREVLGSDAERVRILATDLDTDVLKHAAAGIYEAEVTNKLDPKLKSKYFEPAAGSPGALQVKTELKRLVRFAQVNLVRDDWEADDPFDVIFCRNVVIYFDSPTRQTLFKGFTASIRPGGLLILGHSEGLGGASLPLQPLGQTVWQRVARTVSPTVAPPRYTAHGHEKATSHAHHVRVPDSHVHASRAGDNRPVARIVIGGISASASPKRVRTVLGSCIAACLWDPVSRIGGMNHFMLPDGDADSDSASRFGVHAMELLINELMHLGADRRRIQAKVYGGASVLQLSNQKENVADRNVAFIRSFLKTEGIPIVAERLGGVHPLDVELLTDTGETHVSVLDSAASKVTSEEANYRARVKSKPRPVETSNVDLF